MRPPHTRHLHRYHLPDPLADQPGRRATIIKKEAAITWDSSSSRLGFYIVAFWACITLNFLLPGLCPATLFRGCFPKSSPGCARTRSMRSGGSSAWTTGPCWDQYLAYWQHLPRRHGHLVSRFPTPVSEVIAAQIGWTLLLGGTSLVIAVILGNFLGILAAWRRGGFLDSAFPPLLIFVGSFPYFWLAMGALYLFGVILGWFPLRHAFTAGDPRFP